MESNSQSFLCDLLHFLDLDLWDFSDLWLFLLWSEFRVLGVRASALGHNSHLQGIRLVQVDVVDVRTDEMVVPVEVEAHDAALALVLGVVVAAGIFSTLEHLAAARVDLEVIEPASYTPINAGDVLAFLQREFPVLILSARRAKVLDCVSTGQRLVISVDNLNAGDIGVEVKTNLGDLWDMVVAVLLDNFVHGVSAPLWAIASMDLSALEALLPRILPYALSAAIPVAEVLARVMTSSLIRVEISTAAVATVLCTAGNENFTIIVHTILGRLGSSIKFQCAAF